MSLLTGPRIAELVAAGEILIDPFDPARVGPNSYDLTLADLLRVYAAQLDYRDWAAQTYGRGLSPAHGRQVPDGCVLEPYRENRTADVLIPADGLVLVPGVLYVGSTIEFTRTAYPYAPMIEGRSTWARLGLQVHLTGGWGDVGFEGRWVLEMLAATPVRVRAGDRVAQLAFYQVSGPPKPYSGRYQGQSGPVAARPLPEPKERS